MTGKRRLPTAVGMRLLLRNLGNLLQACLTCALVVSVLAVFGVVAVVVRSVLLSRHVSAHGFRHMSFLQWKRMWRPAKSQALARLFRMSQNR